MQTKDQSDRQNADQCRVLSAAEVASVGGGTMMIPRALLYPIYIAAARAGKK